MGILRRIPMWVFASGIVAILVLAVLIWRHVIAQRALYAEPAVGAAIVNSDLHETTLKLRDSFGKTDTFNSKSNTEDYLDYMSRLREDCSEIHRYSTQVTQASTDSTPLSQYLTKSDQMCDELFALTADTIRITQAALPLLVADSHLKRYQTLPIVSGNIRNSHLKVTRDVIDQLPSVLDRVDYPTQLKSYAEQLKQSMDSNKGLSYLPALANFQTQMYSERQRFWNDDAELGSLINALGVYQERYCQNLANSGKKLPVCSPKQR